MRVASSGSLRAVTAEDIDVEVDRRGNITLKVSALDQETDLSIQLTPEQWSDATEEYDYI